MKINKKYIRLIGIFAFFSVVYILLAVKTPRNSLQLVPQWTIDVETDILVSSSSLLPFKLGQYIGYYAEDGGIASSQFIEERGVVSSHYIATFSSDATSTPFYTAKGVQSGIFEKAGFPFFQEDRIFLFHPSGNSFSSHASDGKEKWVYENYVPITAFSSNENSVVVGFADGKVIVFDINGNVTQEFYPGGSEYEIIFGANISQSGRFVACLSGLEVQRIVITDVEGNTSKIVYHEYVENEIAEQVFVQFSSNEQYAFINEKDLLTIIDIEEKTTISVNVAGRVITVKEIRGGDYYFILSKNRGESTITILNKNLFEVGSFSFEEKNTFIDSDGDFVYIGNDTSISKLLVK